MVVVSYDEMCRALEMSLGKRGMSPEEISNLAEYILNFFGFADRIIDNILQPNDRDLFYMLEEEGFLKTESTEVAIAKGKEWRIHYWVLRKQRIKELSGKKEPERPEEKEFNIYESMSEEAWARKAPPTPPPR
jgi:hypothetical protein